MNHKHNPVREKSFDFAISIVDLYKTLVKREKEYVLSKQLLKSGTSPGAMISEAAFAESSKDFIHKLAIAQKEINESIYWLNLLNRGAYLTKTEYDSNHSKAVEVIKLLTSIIKTMKTK